ncbi:MAG TPA: DUF2946 family protein, partial [Pyrinomonadaceae bacterium]|nr:DUF2946 family protein [Pyrinomonadaceae bacterium]
QVTSNTNPAARLQNTLFARSLAFVLLAFVTYASTTVHKHGSFTLAPTDGSSAATHFKDDAGAKANDSRSTGECLICQLRQQLSASLLGTLPQIAAPQAQAQPALATALPSASRFSTPQRGRAPPPASLS